jgi:hypothetical protein
MIYLKAMDKKLMQQYSQPILPLVSATLYLPHIKILRNSKCQTLAGMKLHRSFHKRFPREKA